MRLVVGENSYVTVSEADKIVESYFTSTDSKSVAYNNLDDDDKIVILYRSCVDMQKLPYRGFKKEKNQKLAFPRLNRLGYESDEDMVKLAQVLNAIEFIDQSSSGGSSKIRDLADNGVTYFSLGSFSIRTDGNVKNTNYSYSGKVEQVLPAWLNGGVRIR